MNLLELNVGNMLQDTGQARLSDLIPRASETKAKIDKLYFIKLKAVSRTQEKISKLKRQCIEEKKYLQITSDKELITRICMEFK